ncbi:Xaa-Pro aminopeptidase [Thiohalocapsa marina]|uniref:Xaa-Pro aminopeptidase n=1 Tax=Thiohalocapsa marina TaxID=424902 RepID=A0A5M8FU83_9GAMM|nr:Xaa-Pro aminopeptidase [Thiohalocapsa marina]KAA6187343.1 Xaa-Pro aminopeptidase [Thiohalocapsa marina]
MPDPKLARALRRRRREAARVVGADGVLILAAAGNVTRNRDVHYPFRQDSDFGYLTGFPEPDAVAVLVPKRKHGEFILFCRPRDKERELWDGARLGVEGAVADYGADEAHPLDAIDSTLPELLADRTRIFYPLGTSDALDRRVMGWLRQVRAKARAGVSAPTELITSDRILHEQRLIKSKPERDTMRRAARISAAAHRQLMRGCRPGMNEQQLEALFVATCAAQGARHQAYQPIVGGGANACVLHYVDNAAPLRDGDLVLVDAGCELDDYASDITRTFPVNGRFSPAQRRLYALVLAAQKAAIAAVKPGNRWNAPHQAALRVLTRGLLELGLIAGDPKHLSRLIKDEAYKPFYMHRTGHWLGMDVHDVGSYRHDGKWRRLEPGMVLTVEPGLYVAPDADAPADYRGIGIRIEDDVLVTTDGCEVLSRDAPKEIDDIEHLMAAAQPPLESRT